MDGCLARRFTILSENFHDILLQNQRNDPDIQLFAGASHRRHVAFRGRGPRQKSAAAWLTGVRTESGMSAITYTSDLPTDECLRRLLAQRRPGFWTPWAEGTISARVRDGRFRLFAWGPANLRNSFAPFFHGRLEEVDGKTRIYGHFRMHRLVHVFLFLWFGGLLAMAGLLLFLPASAWGSGQRPPMLAVLGPVVMGLLGFGLVRFGQWLGRGQAESLRRFLSQELEARPIGKSEQFCGALRR